MLRYIAILIFLSHQWYDARASLPVDNTLTGTVKDKNGMRLTGVVVELPDLKKGTVTDSNGSYKLEGLPKGRYAVVASLISYSRITILVDIAGDTRQDLTLAESAIESHEVVITGQSKATEIKRTPVPVEVISNQYLRTNISTNIIDAIAKVPGVAAVSTGPNVSKPIIRGLGFNRVLTLSNGMRQEGQQWGDEHGIEVDEYSVDKIELVKGPSSLIYGSDALAGVVNLISAKPAAEGTIAGEVLSEYQSNNGMFGISGMLSGNKKGVYWLGRVSNKLAKNYQNSVDGRVYGTGYREMDASGALGINRKWGYSHLDISLYDDIQAIPDGSRDSASRKFTKQITEADTVRPIVSDNELNTYKLPGLNQHIQHYRVLSSNRFNLLNGQLAVNAGFERSVRREFSHPEHTDIAGLYLQLNTYTYDVKYHFQSWKGWDVTAGVNGMYQVNDVTKGTDFIIPSYHQFDIGAFAVIEKKFKKLSIAGGVRHDNRRFSNEALNTKTDPATGFDVYAGGSDTTGLGHPFFSSTHSFSGATFSLGATYIFSRQFAVKANLARGFRAPNIVEISSSGIHPGTSLYQLGNPGFTPEFSLQGDLGIEYTSAHLSVNVSVFKNDIDNYIYNQKLSAAYGGDSMTQGVPTYQFRQSKAALYGGEASIDIHPHPLDWLHFETGVSVVYGENRGGGISDSSRYLPFMPPVHFTSELRGDFKQPARNLRNAFVKIQALVYAKQDRVYLADNTETTTPGYVLCNAGLGTDITDRNGKIYCNIALFASNLFDAAYQDHLARPKYFEPYPNDPRGRSGIYSMGRNVGIKLTVPIGRK